jgi:hypothetical protein
MEVADAEVGAKGLLRGLPKGLGERFFEVVVAAGHGGFRAAGTPSSPVGTNSAIRGALTGPEGTRYSAQWSSTLRVPSRLETTRSGAPSPFRSAAATVAASSARVR